MSPALPENVQHTYDREQKLVENMMSPPPVRAAAAVSIRYGWIRLEQRRDAEDAGSGLSERETV